MATAISVTDELQIQLKDVTGDYQRIIRIVNPQDGLTRDDVTSALAPAILAMTSSKDGDLVPYFYDDTDSTVGLTQIGTIERVRIEKSVTPIT